MAKQLVLPGVKMQAERQLNHSCERALGMGRVLVHTDKAVLVHLIAWGRDLLVPWSCLTEASELYRPMNSSRRPEEGDELDVVVSKSFAEQNGVA